MNCGRLSPVSPGVSSARRQNQSLTKKGNPLDGINNREIGSVSSNLKDGEKILKRLISMANEHRRVTIVSNSSDDDTDERLRTIYTDAGSSMFVDLQSNMLKNPVKYTYNFVTCCESFQQTSRILFVEDCSLTVQFLMRLLPTISQNIDRVDTLDAANVFLDNLSEEASNVACQQNILVILDMNL